VLAAQHTHERPVILAASTATWLEQAARHLDDAALAGRVDHILADSHQRCRPPSGSCQRDGDCATSAVVIGPDGVVRQISTGARRPLAAGRWPRSGKRQHPFLRTGPRIGGARIAGHRR